MSPMFHSQLFLCIKRILHKWNHRKKNFLVLMRLNTLFGWYLVAGGPGVRTGRPSVCFMKCARNPGGNVINEGIWLPKGTKGRARRMSVFSLKRLNLPPHIAFFGIFFTFFVNFTKKKDFEIFTVRRVHSPAQGTFPTESPQRPFHSCSRGN